MLTVKNGWADRRSLRDRARDAGSGAFLSTEESVLTESRNLGIRRARRQKTRAAPAASRPLAATPHRGVNLVVFQRVARRICEFQVRTPLKRGILVSHRLRTDVRWLGQDAELSNRWRYRLMVEREFAKGRTSVVPFVNLESYYDSRYQTVNRLRSINGATVEWSPRYGVEGNVAYQHDTRSSVTNLLALNVIVHVYLEKSRLGATRNVGRHFEIAKTVSGDEIAMTATPSNSAASATTSDSQANGLGTHIGHYRLEALIGRGGMGEVFRGLDTRLNRPVAIKVLSPALAQHEHSVERFLREARRLRAQPPQHRHDLRGGRHASRRPLHRTGARRGPDAAGTAAATRSHASHAVRHRTADGPRIRECARRRPGHTRGHPREDLHAILHDEIARVRAWTADGQASRRSPRRTGLNRLPGRRWHHRGDSAASGCGAARSVPRPARVSSRSAGAPARPRATH